MGKGTPNGTPVPPALLEELQQLRTTLTQALEEAKQTEALNSLLKEENATLLKANGKKDYRIKILKNSLQEAIGQDKLPITP